MAQNQDQTNANLDQSKKSKDQSEMKLEPKFIKNMKSDDELTKEVRKIMQVGERFEKFFEGTDTMKKINEFIEIQHKGGKTDLDIMKNMFTTKDGKLMMNSEFTQQDFLNMSVPQHLVDSCEDNFKKKMKDKSSFKEYENLFDGIIERTVTDSPYSNIQANSPEERREKERLMKELIDEAESMEPLPSFSDKIK